MSFPARPRLFYDLPSSPRKAEAVLLVSDLLMFLAPLFLVTAIFERVDSGADIPLLVLWAVVPRCMSRFMNWLGRPHDNLRSFLLALVFVLLNTFLTLAGWEIIYMSAAETQPIGFGTALLTLGAWASGYILFQPRSYRLYDFLCGSAMLLGLFEAKPLAWLLVPIFLVALFFSASTRHLLLDVYVRSPRPFLNLQNPRVMAVGAAIVTSTFFLALLYGLQGSFEFDESIRQEARGRAERRYFSEFVAAPVSFDENDLADESKSAAGQGGRPLRVIDRIGRSKRYSYRGDLRGVARWPDDPRVAMIVRPASPAGARASEESHRLNLGPGALFRGLTFSSFDAPTQSFAEEGRLVERDWPSAGIVEITFEVAPPASSPLSLEYEVRLPVFRSLVSLNRTLKLALRGASPKTYRINDAGDVMPRPGLRPDSRYLARVAPVYPNRFPEAPSTGTHPLGTRYLSLPEEEALGLDLGALSRQVFGRGARSIQEKIGRLKAYFQRQDFLYSRQQIWQDRNFILREFLGREKRGSCTHYSTAAGLLLRSAGVSTRFAAGYLGGDWNPTKRELYLKLSMLHAWIEVYFPDQGWFPIDPTEWVPYAKGETGPARQSDLAASAPAPAAFAGDETENEPLLPLTDSATRERERLRTYGGKRRNRRKQEEDLTVEVTEVEDEAEEAFMDWLQFDDAMDSDASTQAGGETFAPGIRDSGPVTGNAGQDGSGGPAMANESNDPTTRFFQRYRKPLRIVLIVLSAGALLLLAVTFFWSKKDDEDAESLDVMINRDWIGVAIPDEDLDDYAFGDDSPRSRVIALYHQLQRDLVVTRSHRRPSQTPLEHSRTQLGQHEQLRESFQGLLSTFYRALYGDGDIKEADAQAFEKNCRRVRRILG